jgi:hypothetical protein
MGVALVFGVYYLWIGLRDFISSGGLGIVEATEQAIEETTATAVQAESNFVAITPLPTFTPLPECQDFVVVVPNAIIRASSSTTSPILDSISEGETVCVIDRAANADWYVIDQNPLTRRIETGYMFHNIIEALNPTPTPSKTFTPPPTITSMPSPTRTITPTPEPTDTPDPNATHTPTPTYTPSPTLPVQSA